MPRYCCCGVGVGVKVPGFYFLPSYSQLMQLFLVDFIMFFVISFYFSIVIILM